MTFTVSANELVLACPERRAALLARLVEATRVPMAPAAVVSLHAGAAVYVRCGRWRRYEMDGACSRLTGAGPERRKMEDR